MKVNIKSYVKRLKNIDLLDTVVEAVANSVHAAARNVQIFLNYKEMSADIKCIESIEIVDDGLGFHIENQRSFDEFMSEYKIKLGCRGVGRFSFLKVFSVVNYESVYSDEDGYKKVEFSFKDGFSFENITSKNVSTSNTYTKLFLGYPNEDYLPLRQSGRSAEQVKSYIMEKLLAEFISRDDFDLKISLYSDGVLKEVICDIDIPHFEETVFSVRGNPDQHCAVVDESVEFRMRYFFDNENRVKAYYCTEGRAVQEASVKARLDDGCGAVFLFFSKYLDRFADDYRTRYDVPKDAIVSMRDIEKEVGKAVSSAVLEKFPNILEINSEIIEGINKKYPYLRRYISDDDSVGVVDEKSIVKSALVRQRKARDINIENYEKLESKYKTILDSHGVCDDLVKDFVEHIENTQEISKENLVEFVWYSDTILKFIRHIIDGKSCNEDVIHNLLIQKKDSYTRDECSYHVDKNNMWIFGHQFMGYDFVASDRSVSDILKSLDVELVKNTYVDMRPDIFMVMPRSDMASISDVVVFELKKIGAQFYDRVKGIDQIRVYASALKKNIQSLSIVWGFLVVEFDEKFKEYLEDNKFSKTYTESGFAYSEYNDKTKLLLTVLDIDAVVSMAKQRNDVLAGILKSN